jgi:iron complex transport system substrate-binding protein
MQVINITLEIVRVIKVRNLTAWVLGLLLIYPSFVQGEERTFEDAIGRYVSVSYPPKRIVSLAPDITETLFALGLESEIVGVTRFSNFPLAAQKKSKVGSYVAINIEAIVDLKPDLILGTGAGNPRIQVVKLSDLGFSVFIVFPKNVDDILETIHLIGKVVGREKRAKQIVRELKDRMQGVRERVRGQEKPLVFLQIGRDPIFTVSKGSFANDLISLAGGENIAKNEKVPYPSYTLEEIILKSPEVIIISSMYRDRLHSRWLKEWKRWSVLPAVKNNRLYIIDSDLIDRPSPRIIDGLEQMAQMIHPEAFNN